MAIVNLTLPSFRVLTLDDYTTISTRWKKYKRRFENLVIALNVTDDRKKTYEKVITLLDEHFAPKSNITYKRYLSQNFKQNYDEKIYPSCIRVKQQALKQDFGDTNGEIKQQLILPTNSNKLGHYSFCNPDITLEKFLTYTKTLEYTERQADEIEKMSKYVEDVNLTRKSKKKNKADEIAK